MDFGILVLAKPNSCGEEAKLAEECGFSHAWVADTHMLSGDVYMCLALMAAQTSHLKLGTGVAVPGGRIAPMTASCLATLNQLAPGRVCMGIGTGNSARRSMGMPPCSLRELRDHVEIVRELLQGKMVDYREGEVQHAIRFFHQDMDFMNLQDPVPIYLAANAPKAMALAGEIGDGFMTSRTNTVAGWQTAWPQVSKGAERAGKDPGSLYSVILTTACLLRPGEDFDSPRVKAEAGPWATVALHSLYETLKDPQVAPEPIRPLFGAYKAFTDKRIAANERYYLDLHDGHCLYVQPEEEQFVTPEVIQATTMTSTPEALLERLHGLEAAGVKQVAFIPPTNGYMDFVKECSEMIIGRF